LISRFLISRLQRVVTLDGAPVRPKRGLGAGLLLSLAACGGDPTATDPKKVFEDGFTTPIEEVTIEAEGGTRVRGYDAWLKILPHGRLLPRRQEEYERIDCAEPRVYFNRVLGSDELAPEHSRLECIGLRDSRLDFNNGRWLVQNRSDGRYYFRSWKQYP